MPRLGGIGPKLGTPASMGTISTPLSLGSGAGGLGAVGGLGGGFGDYVGGLRKVGLDVLLVIDTTESMQFVIDAVKKKLSQLVGALQRMMPTARVGGGDLVSLDEDKVLIRQVLERTFGARWKVEMAPYLKDLSQAEPMRASSLRERRPRIPCAAWASRFWTD